jgi:Phage gp6-like head-tail connector protein
MPEKKEQVYPYALTTLSRVKDILGLGGESAFDSILTRYINSVTDNIERACGKTGLERSPNDGHFIQKTYTNEVYSVRGQRQERLVLRNSPVTYAFLTGDLTNGQTVVNNCSTVAGLVVDMPIVGVGISGGTTITVINTTAKTITLSQGVGTTQTGVYLEASGLLSFEWRAGTPSNPFWTAFIPDQFEIEEQGASGIIRVYGAMPRLYSNMLRATYIAGYAKDWESAGNGTTHQLPADLTNTCENIVIRLFKRRQLDGKASENIQGATTTWRNQLDAQDLAVISAYTRVGTYF